MKKQPKSLKRPIVMLGITEDCNMQCRHCYNESGGKHNFSPSKATLFSNVEKIAKIAGAINYTGGEPFLRPELPELLELSHSLGADNIITTNGLRFLAKDGSALLDRIQDSVYMLKIGMMGATPATNDYVRGKGHFDVAMKGFDLMAQYNLVTCAKVSLDKHNMHEIDALAEMALEHKIGVLVLGQLVNMGNASKYLQDFVLDQDDLRRVNDEITRIAGKYAGAIKISPHCTISGVCSHPAEFYTVTARGGVSPCLMREDLAIGNIAYEDVNHLFRQVDLLRRKVKTHPSMRDILQVSQPEEKYVDFLVAFQPT